MIEISFCRDMFSFGCDLLQFKEKATYTQQEIDALRIEWAEYVDDFIPIDETLD